MRHPTLPYHAGVARGLCVLDVREVGKKWSSGAKAQLCNSCPSAQVLKVHNSKHCIQMESSNWLQASEQFPKQHSLQPSYGTAGFRSEASLLPSTVYRTAALTVLRSVVSGGATGLMITASHNPEADNGVKVLEPSAEYLVASWECHATDLARCSSTKELADALALLASTYNIRDCSSAVVLLGYDTRPSSRSLFEIARTSIQAMNARVLDCGLVTTPQLHFMVQQVNAGQKPSEDVYFETLLQAFKSLNTSHTGPTDTLHVDCANGIGAPKLVRAAKILDASGLKLVLHNTGDGRLNYLCGADYVQKEQRSPCNFETVTQGARYVMSASASFNPTFLKFARVQSTRIQSRFLKARYLQDLGTSLVRGSDVCIPDHSRVLDLGLGTL
jgi:Phosphoglucomutase/phosphomannomutase, alpha/beta/alpha domain I